MKYYSERHKYSNAMMRSRYSIYMYCIMFIACFLNEIQICSTIIRSWARRMCWDKVRVFMWWSSSNPIRNPSIFFKFTKFNLVQKNWVEIQIPGNYLLQLIFALGILNTGWKIKVESPGKLVYHLKFSNPRKVLRKAPMNENRLAQNQTICFGGRNVFRTLKPVEVVVVGHLHSLIWRRGRNCPT